MSFALVLVATVLLVLGLMSDDGLTLIYISIACSALAGLVLLVAVRMSRPRTSAAPDGPAPLADADAAETAPAEDRELATVATTTLPASPTAAPEPSAATVDTAETPAPVVDDDEQDDLTTETFVPGSDGEWDGEFPIAEYDDLKVSEIMPLLPELYPEELDIVEERERSTKNRSTIISRIDELRRGDGDGEAAAPAAEESEWAADDDGWDDDGALPISGYDDLTVADIRPRLADLDPDELDTVRAHEANGANRATVLREIDRLLGPAAPSPAPARRTAAKKATAAKKRATAARKAAPAKKAATKATAKKAASKKAGAKKATSRKATSKKATSKKAGAKKSGATKTATAKKAARKSTKKR